MDDFICLVLSNHWSKVKDGCFLMTTEMHVRHHNSWKWLIFRFSTFNRFKVWIIWPQLLTKHSLAQLNMAELRNPGISSIPQTAAVHGDSTSQAVEMDPVEYTLRKRLPRKLPKRRNDVYVNMKTDFRAQLARCQKLLEGGGHREICVHGLGLAINRAINIALQLQASSQGALQLAANTSTVELVDDLEPEDPDEAGEPMTRTRNNSAIHIKVFYPDPQWPKQKQYLGMREHSLLGLFCGNLLLHYRVADKYGVCCLHRWCLYHGQP